MTPSRGNRGLLCALRGDHVSYLNFWMVAAFSSFLAMDTVMPGDVYSNGFITAARSVGVVLVTAGNTLAVVVMAVSSLEMMLYDLRVDTVCGRLRFIEIDVIFLMLVVISVLFVQSIIAYDDSSSTLVEPKVTAALQLSVTGIICTVGIGQCVGVVLHISAQHEQRSASSRTPSELNGPSPGRDTQSLTVGPSIARDRAVRRPFMGRARRM